MAPAHRITCVVLILAGGCHRSPSAQHEVDARRDSTSVHTEPLLPRVDGIDEAPLPSDVYEEHSKTGHRNVSLFRRQLDARDRVLAGVKPRLQQSTPEELIKGMAASPDFGFVVPANTVEYLVWRDGNKLIEEELRRRGESARDALVRYRNDGRTVFTGSNGPPVTIGWMCQRLLNELDGGVP